MSAAESYGNSGQMPALFCERSEECNKQMGKGMWTVVISANALRGPRGLHKLSANPKK